MRTYSVSIKWKFCLLRNLRISHNTVLYIKGMNEYCSSKPPTYLERKKMVCCIRTQNGQMLLKIEPDHNIQITLHIWKSKSKYDLISNTFQKEKKYFCLIILLTLLALRIEIRSKTFKTLQKLKCHRFLKRHSHNLSFIPIIINHFHFFHCIKICINCVGFLLCRYNVMFLETSKYEKRNFFLGSSQTSIKL